MRAHLPLVPLLLVALIGGAGCDAGPLGDGDEFSVTDREADTGRCVAGENVMCEGAAHPAAAGNPARGEYLVLWTGEYLPARHELYGRRFRAPGGEAAGSERVVTTLPASGARSLTVRHDRSTGGYLAAWYSHGAGNGSLKSRALFMTLDGRGGLRSRVEYGSRGELVDLDADPAGERHLLLESSYEDAVPTGTGGLAERRELWARSLGPGGRTIGLERLAAHDPARHSTNGAEATHDSRTGAYLVARLISGQAGEQFELIRLGRELEVLGLPAQVPERPAARAVDVALAHNPASRRTLLAWVDRRPDQSRRILGAWVDEDGAPGAPFALGDELGPGEGSGLGLAPAGDGFVLRWRPGNPFVIRYATVEPDRRGSGPARELFSKEGGEATDSTVAFGPGDSFLAVWTDGLREPEGQRLRGRVGEL